MFFPRGGMRPVEAVSARANRRNRFIRSRPIDCEHWLLSSIAHERAARGASSSQKHKKGFRKSKPQGHKQNTRRTAARTNTFLQRSGNNVDRRHGGTSSQHDCGRHCQRCARPERGVGDGRSRPRACRRRGALSSVASAQSFAARDCARTRE